jgi:hypothetical protein
MDNNEQQRAQALQAMDFVIQGLTTGMWGIVSGYIENPRIAAEIMEGAVRLYLNSLHIYHDQALCSQQAQRMIEMLEPFAAGEVKIDEDNWFDSLQPALLEQLG